MDINSRGEKKKEFEIFYIETFNEKHVMEHFRDIFLKRVLNNELADWLARPFEDNEIVAALKLCGKEKAPRPDGFSAAFYLDSGRR